MFKLKKKILSQGGVYMNCENNPIKFLKFYSLEALGNCQPDLPVVQRFIEHVA